MSGNSLAAADRDTLLVMGDSISAAYGMDLESGWVQLLQQRLKQRGYNYQVINASISGDTSAGGLGRLPRLLEQYTPSVVVIELGGNDGLRGYPIKQLRENLITMGELARASGARVMFLPMEVPPNLGPRYTQHFRESFEVAAQACDGVIGPFILDNVAIEPALMQADGIHPTADAQPILLDNVWPGLEPLL